MQRQLELTDRYLETGQLPTPPASMMAAPSMEVLGRELVRLCDGIEKFGLVDYQMGVAEDQIIEGTRHYLVHCAMNSISDIR